MRMLNDRDCCKKSKYDRYFVTRSSSYDLNNNQTTYTYYLGKTAFKMEEYGTGSGVSLDINTFTWSQGNSVSNGDWYIILDTLVCEGKLVDHKSYDISQKSSYNISVYADTTNEYVHILIKYKERPRLIFGNGFVGDYKEELRLITVHINSQTVVYNKKINFNYGSLKIDKYNSRVKSYSGGLIQDYMGDNAFSYIFKNPVYFRQDGYLGMLLNEDPVYMYLTSSKIILTNMSYKYFNDTLNNYHSLFPYQNIVDNILYIWIEIDTITGTLIKEKIGYTDYYNKYQIVGRETKLIQDLEHIVGLKFAKHSPSQGAVEVVTGKLDYDIEGNPYITNPVVIDSFNYDLYAPNNGNWSRGSYLSWCQDVGKHTYVSLHHYNDTLIATHDVYRDNILKYNGSQDGSVQTPKEYRAWIEPCFLDGYILINEWITPDEFPLSPGECLFQCWSSDETLRWTKIFEHYGDDTFSQDFWLYGPWHFNEHGALLSNDKYIQLVGITVDLKTALTSFNAEVDSRYKYNNFVVNPSYIDQTTNGLNNITYWNITYGFLSPVTNVIDPQNSSPASFYRDINGNVKSEYLNTIVYLNWGYGVVSNVESESASIRQRLNIIRLSNLPDVYFAASD